jgi:predicted MFS family arabinose efflux permease
MWFSVSTGTKVDLKADSRDASVAAATNTARPAGEMKSVAPSIAVMLSVMIALAIMSQFFRSSNGVIASELMHDIGVDIGTLGVISGSFFIIFALLQIPIGVFLDRFGTRRVIPAMLLLAVGGSCLFAMAQSGSGLMAGRFLIGFGFAGVMVGSLVVLSRWQSPTDFTRSMTILFATANAGSLLATAPLALATDWIGWRSTFLLLGLLTAGLALAFFIIVRDRAPGEDGRAPGPATVMESVRGLREVFAVPGLTRVMPLIGIGYASMVTIIGLWGGPYLHEVYRLESVPAGNWLSLMAISMILGTLAFGPVHRRLQSFRATVVAGGGATGLLLLALALATDAPQQVTIALLVALCFAGGYSVVLMAHGLALIPSVLAGRGTTTLNAVLMGGTATLQTVSGEIIHETQAWTGSNSAGYSAFFLFLGALTLVAVAIYRYAPEPSTRRG